MPGNDHQTGIWKGALDQSTVGELWITERPGSQGSKGIFDQIMGSGASGKRGYRPFQRTVGWAGSGQPAGLLAIVSCKSLLKIRRIWPLIPGFSRFIPGFWQKSGPGGIAPPSATVGVPGGHNHASLSGPDDLPGSPLGYQYGVGGGQAPSFFPVSGLAFPSCSALTWASPLLSSSMIPLSPILK
jgi:hypothetical protein